MNTLSLNEAINNLLSHYRRYGTITDTLMDDLDLAYYGNSHNHVLNSGEYNDLDSAHIEHLRSLDALPPFDELAKAGQIVTTAQGNEE